MAFQTSQMMKKEFRLPMVPGMSCGEEMLRRNYHRSHIVGSGLDCATTFDAVPADMSRVNQQFVSSLPMTNANDADAALSDGAAFDLTGYVLRFYGYTVESVAESVVEVERLRKVVLRFYLEDGTMSVSEPSEDNSGITFRANLKRHLVPHPDGTPITLEDLKVGEPITFYGKTYLLYDADAFTRDFYREKGTEQAPALSVPLDQYAMSHAAKRGAPNRLQSITATSPLYNQLTPEQVRATQRFLAYDRQVLRCDCTWDDSASVYGYKHYMTLYYFLADGSIAVAEKNTPNSGREPFPVFFSRQRVVKPTDPSARFDSIALGSVTFKEPKNVAYYTDKDIRIGNVLNLYGRHFLIHDYDAFTRDHLATTYGITEYAPIPGAIPPPFEPPGARRRELSEDEKQAKSHAVGSAELRRHRFDTASVKFLVVLDNGKYEDSIRRFVLTVYPADDTIAIFEPVMRNSGIVGGKFLSRQKVKRPGSEEFYTSGDFFVGARVIINAFPFMILKSDERSLCYMENNGEEFSHSDINKIVRKMRAMLRSKQSGLAAAFRRADDVHQGGLEMSVFLSIMAELHLDMSEQEILTILRFFDKNNESYVSYEEVASRILPEGTVLGGDDRPWKTIHDESLKEETAAFVHDPKAEAEKQRLATETLLAARAADEIKELYEQRRQLFMKELRAITDYAKDGLIGVDEFKMCIRQKLHITSLTNEELNALVAKLFTKKYPRVTYEELMRLFNGTSTLSHTLAFISDMKSE
ncbi:unnamed protein product [Phytomonas sp. EM1]|nr:unnamed protein product [Phytomonas sp. EM1]|eukprot:CCW60987.1 unnamed protein product [Phytomonas sp. isolate EM1]